MGKMARAAIVGPIETGIPVPRSRNNVGLRQRMEALPLNGSFITDASSSGVYAMAKKLGIRVITRPQGKGMIRVWRVSSLEEGE